MGRYGRFAVSGRVGQGLGLLVFGCLTAALVFAPTYLSSRLRPGSGEEGWVEPSGPSRTTVGARVVESRFSENFRDVAKMVSEAPDATTWEALRTLLEGRGETDVWYSIRVAWLMNDGSEAEVTYVRQPYHDEYHFLEFRKLVMGEPPGPETMWAAAWTRKGEPGTEDQGELPPTLLEQLLTSSDVDRRGMPEVSAP